MSVFRDSYGLRTGWIMAILIGGVLVVTGLVVVGATHLAGSACARTAAHMGTRSLYELPAGCFIQDDSGRWVPLDLYRVQRGSE